MAFAPSIAEVLQTVSAQLSREGCRFALLGGLAVSARVDPRFTRDIDLAVQVSSDNEAERLILRMQDLGYTVVFVVEQESVGRMATARLARNDDDGSIVIDLLFASSGIEAETIASAEPIELFPEVVVPVASIAALLALKVLSNAPERPQDMIDIKALAASASGDDWDAARELCAMIEHRGFHRNRHLRQQLDEVRRQCGRA